MHHIVYALATHNLKYCIPNNEQISSITDADKDSVLKYNVIISCIQPYRVPLAVCVLANIFF